MSKNTPKIPHVESKTYAKNRNATTVKVGRVQRPQNPAKGSSPSGT